MNSKIAQKNPKSLRGKGLKPKEEDIRPWKKSTLKGAEANKKKQRRNRKINGDQS